MVPFQYPARRSEQGAALVISLILLAVMTILVISTMRTSILQLRISGSTETLRGGGPPRPRRRSCSRSGMISNPYSQYVVDGPAISHPYRSG